ncbi:uncharacterized protein LOC110154277 [Boleophthalmus pectinirostris]|uniref:uncharacterized protein LOC110154277 n=1 Tax=Boleophthalmus pectinirostris TaxID=150288 RepID=UPI000A1C434B|nr:uncharacterized protein LOC110154277 [Boleophthalmus pectinirostris]
MSSPKYTVYTDSELEQARSSYFEQKRLGSTTSDLSKELFCRLIRNTMTNMVSIARALEDSRYPSKHEVDTVAKRLVEYYPMLKGKKTPESEWGHVTKKLIKRLSNIKSPKKASAPFKKRRMNYEESCSTDFDEILTGSSQASTIILEKSPAAASTPEPPPDSSEDDAGGSADTDVLDSQKSQVRHYNTLQEMYKAKKANKAAVSHLLNLEFDSRRCFITSDVLKDDDRPSTFFDVYPCFKEFDHASTTSLN